MQEKNKFLILLSIFSFFVFTKNIEGSTISDFFYSTLIPNYSTGNQENQHSVVNNNSNNNQSEKSETIQSNNLIKRLQQDLEEKNKELESAKKKLRNKEIELESYVKNDRQMFFAMAAPTCLSILYWLWFTE